MTEFLTTNEVCQILKLKKSAVYHKGLTGEIPGAVKLGKSKNSPVRFRKDVFENFINKLN